MLDLEFYPSIGCMADHDENRERAVANRDKKTARFLMDVL